MRVRYPESRLLKRFYRILTKLNYLKPGSSTFTLYSEGFVGGLLLRKQDQPGERKSCFLLLALKIASAGAVRECPAEAFAKGGNSDEHQESVLNPVLSFTMIQEIGFSGYCQTSQVRCDDPPKSM